MKQWAFVLIMLIFYTRANCQNAIIDSLHAAFKKGKTDSGKAKTLRLLSYYYKNSKPDSALLMAQSAYLLSKKSRSTVGEASSLGMMGAAFNRLGNFAKALESYLEQLKILEERGDADDLATVYISIALVYNSQKDAAKALKYAYIADSIVKAANLHTLKVYTSLNIGDIYTTAGRLDSAGVYTERGYRESVEEKNTLLIGTALNNLGNINFKKGLFTKARYYYTQSIPYLTEEKDYNTLSECYLGLGNTFDQLGMSDSALAYATNAYSLASQNQILKPAVNASLFLTQLYKERNQVDSAFAQQQVYIQLKDSFDNSEKIKALQSLTIAEELRQQQLADEKLAEAKDRDKKLQLLLITAFIPALFFLTVYITKKPVNKKLVQVLGILSLLFFFEFITLLIHPVVVRTANHAPVFELVIFVAIAAIMLPAHHKIEHWVTRKLTNRHEQYLTNLEMAAKKAREEALAD